MYVLYAGFLFWPSIYLHETYYEFVSGQDNVLRIIMVTIVFPFLSKGPLIVFYAYFV